MERNIDLQISEYKQEVNNLLNKPGLSWGIKQMIFNEAMIAATNANIAVIQAAVQAEKKEDEENGSKHSTSNN